LAIIDKINNSIRGWFGWNTVPSVYFPSSYTATPFATPTNVLGYTPVYRAATLISNDVGRTPASFENPDLERIWSRPNRFQSGYDFRRSMTQQAVLYGNSFALINRRKNGSIYELMPLSVGSVSLDVTGPDPVYITQEYGKVQPENILHIKASLLEGLWASSPVNLCQTSLSIAIGQENATFDMVMNAGGVPKLVLISPNQLNIAARQAIQADYMKNHSGSANASKPIVISENMRVEKISSMFETDAFSKAKSLSIADVSRIFGVPPSYLGESTNTYGTMEWLSRMYLDGCLSHWFESWKAEFELKLGESPIFDTDMIIRPSLAETFSALRVGVEAGIISRNEARAILDYDDEEGLDEFIIAKNMGTGGGTTNMGMDTSNGTAEGDNNGNTPST
jgi:HK97 family phage portal protein